MWLGAEEAAAEQEQGHQGNWECFHIIVDKFKNYLWGKNMRQVTERSNLYSKIAGLLQAAKQNVVRAVKQTMVYSFFEIGRMIWENLRIRC